MRRAILKKFILVLLAALCINSVIFYLISSHMILKKEETDHAYIENCFGRSLYSKQELARTEKELCKGNHAATYGLRMENIFQKRKYQQKTVI